MDGSAFEQKAGTPCGWCVVLGACCNSDPLNFLPAGYFGGSAVSFANLRRDVGSHLSYPAESAALFWVAASLLGLGMPGPCDIFFDNLSAGQGAAGMCSGDPSTGPYSAVRSMHIALQQVCTCRFRHIPSHSSIPGNDLADAGAKMAALGFLESNPSAEAMDLDYWFIPCRLPWLWVYVANACGLADALPPLEGNSLCWTYPASCPRQPAHQLYGRGAEPALAPGRVTATQASLFFCGLRLASYNVLSLRGGSGSERDVPLDLCAGRPEFLRRQFSHAGVHVAALQETRSRDSGFWTPPDYFRFIAAGDPSGHHGCELWISRVLPVACSALTRICPKSENFTVLHQEPRALFLRTQCPPVDLTFVSAHAPHSGLEQREREKWWRHLSSLWSSLVGDRQGFLLGDFNARVCETDVSGPLDPDPLDFNGGLAVDFLRFHGLTLPSTFPSIHQGSSTTWISPQGREHRIDFIAVPEAFFSSACRSWVDAGITSGHAVVDHLCVLMDLSWRQSAHTDRRIGPRRRKLDLQALVSNDGKDFASERLARLQAPAWAVNVHDHAAQVSDEISGFLIERFPAAISGPRSSTMSTESWDVHLRLSSLRRKARNIAKAIDLSRVAASFFAWQAAVLAKPVCHDVVILSVCPPMPLPNPPHESSRGRVGHLHNPPHESSRGGVGHLRNPPHESSRGGVGQFSFCHFCAQQCKGAVFAMAGWAQTQVEGNCRCHA